jgi:hypothetical protein
MSYMRSTGSIGKIQTMITLEASSTKPKKRRNPRKEIRLKSTKERKRAKTFTRLMKLLRF